MKKRLKRLHKLILNSRYALDRTSQEVNIGWLGDLLHMIASRRVIMLGELDRELGQMHVPARPGPEVDQHFDGFASSTPGPLGYMEVCEAEELYLLRELEHLDNDPEVRGTTRYRIANLLRQTRANLRDILYLRKNHTALQV